MPRISEEKKRQRKEHILNHALKVFVEKGYEGSSMDDIVKSSGVSKGGIYNYYNSKDDIFLSISQKSAEYRRKYLKELSTDITYNEKLREYLRLVLNKMDNKDKRGQGKFIFESWIVMSRKKDLKKIAKERYLDFERDLINLINEGIRKGEFKRDLDVKSMVYIIISTLDGIAFFRCVLGVEPSEDIKSTYIEMILNKISLGE
ncbi:MAG: TetR/AcrR family transcriptional regulator [Firmicutes bacterium]|nr:TetR/AcrR family transcriptional regulator [Bacillota bacterium]